MRPLRLLPAEERLMNYDPTRKFVSTTAPHSLTVLSAVLGVLRASMVNECSFSFLPHAPIDPHNHLGASRYDVYIGEKSGRSKGGCVNLLYQSVPNADKREGVKKSKNLHMSLMEAPFHRMIFLSASPNPRSSVQVYLLSGVPPICPWPPPPPTSVTADK